MNNINSIAKSYSNLFETDELKTKELIKKSGQKLAAFKSIVNTDVV